MKIIFLDIDGVLNSEAHWLNCKNNNIPYEEIDDEALKRLKKIVDVTDARIVLSSTWRYMNEGNEIKQYLYRKMREHDLDIFSQTPKINSNRPLEIKTWLQINKNLHIDGFVSLDDDFNENSYATIGINNHTVHTEFYGKEGGLRDRHITEAINILMTRNNPDKAVAFIRI